MNLKQGDQGQTVIDLQKALYSRGFSAGSSDGTYGEATRDAVLAFQKSAGLAADGIVGPTTATALGLTNGQPTDPSASRIPDVTVEVAMQIVPTARANMESNLPLVLNALADADLADKPMIAMALATVRAETGSLLPICEEESRFNTSVGGHPFDLYDARAELGNLGAPDGERFKGRGFVQLTGRSNYDLHGKAIGLAGQLMDNPDLANEPQTAARLLVSFLKAHESEIRAALAENDLAKARRVVNGGSNGQEAFEEAYKTAMALVPDKIVVAQSA